MIGVALLGSTGSIGTQTLNILRAYPDRFRLTAMAAGANVTTFRSQVEEFRPTVSCCASGSGRPTPAMLKELATRDDVDIVVIATSGHDAIPATLAALRAGKIVALANKEAIVCAGELIMPLAKLGTNLRPVDSEHSAIWQSLQAGRPSDVRRILLTASGGPFRNTPKDSLASVSPSQALKHPNWSMGGKITIDSATLMNKGLELIEAHWLFSTPYDRIDVVVQPESIIHSMVEFNDRGIVAQLGRPDMALPIQYALTWPERAPMPTEPLDFAALRSITFEAPDEERFPCLRLARHAGLAGQTYPTVLSAADEIAVSAFVNGEIAFTGIAELVEDALDAHHPQPVVDVGSVMDADHWARDFAAQWVQAHRS